MRKEQCYCDGCRIEIEKEYIYDLTINNRKKDENFYFDLCTSCKQKLIDIIRFNHLEKK